MALRITDIATDLPKLNNELQRVDLHQKQIAELRSQLGQLQKKLLTRDAEKQPTNFLAHNNLLFTWNGSAHSISWPNSMITSNGHFLQVPAGSTTQVVASTYYWAGWNVTHQTMSFSEDIHNLTPIPTIIIVGQIFTGTAGQSGAIGGGGTDPGGGAGGPEGINGRSYKLL